jgi:hypothetical protein
LRKQLTLEHQQAYEGAKGFYYCFIPTAMLSILIGHFFVLEVYLENKYGL